MEFGGGHLAPRLSRPSFAPYVVAHSPAPAPARGLSNAALAGLRDPLERWQKSVEGRRPGGSEAIMRLILLKVKTSN